MQQTEEDKKYNFLKDKNYFDNRFSFIVDENCLENNILFHLMLNDEKGLTKNDLALLIGLMGREKSVHRALSRMVEIKESNENYHGFLEHIASRQGKRFEYVYKIKKSRENDIPSHIKFYADFYKRKIHSENQKGDISKNVGTNNRFNEFSIKRMNNNSMIIEDDNGIDNSEVKETIDNNIKDENILMEVENLLKNMTCLKIITSPTKNTNLITKQ